MQKELLKIHHVDNVAVALINLVAEQKVTFEREPIKILSDIKAKHKIALEDLNQGDKIYMYGVLVGKANGSIKKGDVLTTSNVKHESEIVVKKTASIGWTPQMLINGKTELF